MDYARLTKHFGSQGAIARAVNLSQASISGWKKNGVPELRQLELQLLTGGKLRADPSIIKKYSALLGAQPKCSPPCGSAKSDAKICITCQRRVIVLNGDDPV